MDGTPIRSKAEGKRGLERFEQTILQPVTYQIQIVQNSNEPIGDDARRAIQRNLELAVTAIRSRFQMLADRERTIRVKP